MPSVRSALCVVVACLANLLSPATVPAGGGPQNLLLIVNPRSWASLTIANHYMALRKVPASNVVYLDWPDSPVEAADVDAFRQRILEPILKLIDSRGLAGQIDYVAYSADFPYRVDVKKDLDDQKLGLGFAPFGSINSLTFLWQLVKEKKATPLQLESNFYFSRPGDQGALPESRAFHLLTTWNQHGQPGQGPGQHHLLSTMLAMTVGRGNSVSEAIDYLRRSARADATSPKGTIYFASTSDPRCQVREPQYAPAIAALQALGVQAEITNGVLPQGKKDVQGLTMGAANFDWPGAHSTILPGAICDNLTSTGAFLHDAGNQTSMCEFLRYGAAGASGTTVEPLAIVNKFPTPFLHVHYARGCSLAESFYQSVHGPFQLLIVGDPLCQPWAKPPRVSVSGVEAGGLVSGKIKLTATATAPDGKPVRGFELFVDGRRMAVASPGAPLELDTTTIIDGFHELTVVAIDSSPIEVQGRTDLTIVVSNKNHSVLLSAPKTKIKYGQLVRLRVSAGEDKEAAQLALFHASRGLARIEAASGDKDIDSRVFGMGPLRVQAVSLDSSGRALAISAPLELTVEPADPLRGESPPSGAQTFPGLALTLASGRRVPVDDTIPYDWLKRAGVGEDETYKLSGYVNVAAKDVYQFAFGYMGQLSIAVDGHLVYKGNVPEQASVPWFYVPVTLAAGTHRVEIVGQGGKYRRLEMRFGGPGALLIGKRNFRHAG